MQLEKADYGPEVKRKGTALVLLDGDNHRLNVIWDNDDITDGI